MSFFFKNTVITLIIRFCSPHVLSSCRTHLQERSANKCLFLIDGSRAEHIAGPQVEGDVLDHVSQKLEVVDVADKVHAVHLREADEYVLGQRDVFLIQLKITNFLKMSYHK